MVKNSDTELAGLIVVGDRVLIKPKKLSSKSKGGLFLPPGYKEKEELLASIPKYQQDARIKGYPSLGSGAVYSYNEDSIVIEPRTIPLYFQHAYAIDVGWKATACIAIAIDPDAGDVFVTREYKRGEAMPDEHATAIRLMANNATGAIDPAARGRSQKDGVRLMDEYQQLGLRLVLANNEVEAGIFRLQQLMSTGRLRIFNTCPGVLTEMRQYQRGDDGKVIKRNDHLLDALRYAVMTERIHLRLRPEGWKPKRKNARFAWTGGAA
jgi:hypothetical protein